MPSFLGEFKTLEIVRALCVVVAPREIIGTTPASPMVTHRTGADCRKVEFLTYVNVLCYNSKILNSKYRVEIVRLLDGHSG